MSVISHFKARVLKDGKITIDKKTRDIFNINEGDLIILQFIRKAEVTTK